MENLDIKFEELCNWIQNNGGYINPKISIKNGKYGRSVVANEKIENENIFHLPKN